MRKKKPNEIDRAWFIQFLAEAKPYGIKCETDKGIKKIGESMLEEIKNFIEDSHKWF